MIQAFSRRRTSLVLQSFPLSSIFFHVAELVFTLQKPARYKVQNKEESQNLLEAVFVGLVDSRKSHSVISTDMPLES